MAILRQTSRQHIIRLLQDRWLSSHDLATLLSISERLVEDHLVHIVKTMKRDPMKQLLYQPAACRACNFVFHNRKRLTNPSRCPKCKEESVIAPRYEIKETLKS